VTALRSTYSRARDPESTYPQTLDIRVDAEDLAAALRAKARRGLTATPKDLAPKWFYDPRGSQLYEAIIVQPEYYPARREREILRAHALEIAALSRPDTLVELGSGAATKTRILLDALEAAGRLSRYVPFDICEQVVRDATAAIARDYPALAVTGVVGDFGHHLGNLPIIGRRLVAFLGGTIGNLLPAERCCFLGELRSTMTDGDHLLLGADLVKEQARLVAAYDDAAGVTAEFNRNVLAVINAQLGAAFRLDRFEHVARWDPDAERIEMRLRSCCEQTVAVPGLGIEVAFERGEEMRTEVSAKFRRPGLEAELATASFKLVRWWTDTAGDFAVTLAEAT
jgi:L-histidine N-alpha-methyltransferase